MFPYKKEIVFLFGITFLVLSLTFSVSAQSGCFTYEDSPLYCQDIDMEEGQEECTLYEDCAIDKIFSAGSSCSNIKKFPGCHEILCKSSCQLELAGRCSAGAVPEIKADEWCSSGCCKFVSSGQNYCSYKKSRWLCEIDAKNKNTAKFSFESSVTEKSCTQSCAAMDSTGVSLVNKEIENEEIVSPSDSSADTPEAKVSPEKSNLPETKPATSPITPVKEEEGSSSFWWIFFSLFFVGVIFYLVRYTQLIPLNEVVRKESQDLSAEEEAEALKNISSSGVSSFISWLQPTRRKNSHKEKLKHRQEFFLETGMVPAKEKLDNFSRLKKLGGRHTAPEVRTEKSSEKSAWERMRGLTAERKASSNVSSQKPVSPPSKTRSPVFDELRKIVKK